MAKIDIKIIVLATYTTHAKHSFLTNAWNLAL